jgi:hypothetical protein
VFQVLPSSRAAVVGKTTMMGSAKIDQGEKTGKKIIIAEEKNLPRRLMLTLKEADPEKK